MNRGQERPTATAVEAVNNTSAPRWLVGLTVLLTVVMLYMAVAETAAWTHYFIDTGEYIALIGLAFVVVAGSYLYARRRLAASLPLLLPWFLYPVITQGDQLIDNMAIGGMRLVVHILLALIFAAPIGVLVVAARRALAPAPGGEVRKRWWTALCPGLRQIERGDVREGTAAMILTLLVVEMWVAHAFLGTLMIATLVAMALAVLWTASLTAGSGFALTPRHSERWAMGILMVGVVMSFGVYAYYRNLPTSQQGTVSPFHGEVDDHIYALDHALLTVDDPDIPSPAVYAEIREVLTGYSESIQGLFDAYYILDRNYNYWFHNELFLRNTPVMADFRAKALAKIAEMKQLAWATTAHLEAIDPMLPTDRGVSAFLHEIRRFVEYNFQRAEELAELTAEFQRTKAGLQHATHSYEGEAKVLGSGLVEILDKHQGITASVELAAMSDEFTTMARSIHQVYENRIVGF